jgi:hypothetical protein
MDLLAFFRSANFEIILPDPINLANNWHLLLIFLLFMTERQANSFHAHEIEPE